MSKSKSYDINLETITKKNETKNVKMDQNRIQLMEKSQEILPKTEKTSRLFFIDNLRIFLTILVVLHHLALIYGAVGLYYYVDLPLPNPQEFTVFLVFLFFNQAWFMGAFFLLAGYFTPRSFDRKGAGSFFKARLLRLGIPTLIFILLLGPIASFGVWTLPASVTGTLPPPDVWYSAFMDVGPLWFCVMLLIFTLGYAAWKMLVRNRTPSSTSKPSPPSYPRIVIFILALALASYLIRIIIPIGTYVPLIPPDYINMPTISYLPQYLSFFVLGIVAYRRDWFRTLPSSMGVVGFVAAVVAGILLFPLAFSGQWFSLENNPMYLGNGHWQSAIYALWDSIFAVGMCMGMITLFRHFFNKQGKVSKFLSQHSYSVFIIHIPIAVWLAVVLSGIDLGKYLKFGFAAVIVIPTCFAVAYMIQKITKKNIKKLEKGVKKITQNGNNAIEVKDLKKHFIGKRRFNDVKAVDGISFNVKKGEIFGLLGPNGAGKTTTINMLCGLLKPTEGTAKVGGYDVMNNLNEVKELISVCPQEAAVYPFLTGRENIDFFGNMHLMLKEKLNERAEKLLNLLGLFEASKRKAKEYSGGMKRQLNLIVALINEPNILFLDEPTVGMDPRVRRKTWEFISSLDNQDRTIILTTHYIEETEALCDRVAIIDFGKLVALGSPKELMEEHESKNLEEVFLKITGRKILEGI